MRLLTILFLALLSGCATQNENLNKTSDTEAGSAEFYVELGYQQLTMGRIKSAINEFDKAISLCADQYQSSDKAYYAVRSPEEALYYMLHSAVSGKGAVAVGITCADALYLKGYATLDLGDIEQAQVLVEQAIQMAPVNSLYLSELGHIYQLKSDWNEALKAFISAEEAAQTYSPKEVKNTELARAKRGVGYNLIELGRLDEAEEKYKECLQIDSNDQGAQKELQYVQELRNKDESK